MSDPGRHAALLEGLPRDPRELAKIVQGLLIHRHIAPVYQVTLRHDQHAQSHIRALETILDDIVARDGRPLSVSRKRDERQVGSVDISRSFTSRCFVRKVSRHGPAAASAPILKRVNSWIIGSQNTGTREKDVGCSSTHKSTISSANSSE